MSKRRTIQYLALALAFLCPAALAAPGDDPPPAPGMHRGLPPNMPPPMGGFGMPGAPGDFLFGPALHMSGVELSDAQVETITKVRKASQKQRDQIHSTLHSLDDSLRDELYADNIDAAKVKKLQAEIGSARAQLASIGDDEQLQTMQSLTAEQRHSIRMAIARMSLGPAGLKHHEHEKKD